MSPKIDTHLHLVYPDRLSYPWLDDVPALQKPFPLESYAESAKKVGITQAVFMEVDVAPDQALAEVQLVRELAAKGTFPITGIIAAALPESEAFADQIDALEGPLLKGIRRVLHTQDDERSTSQRFRENVASLAERNLSFDLCVLPRQLPLAMELVDACPETQFILDHCGVPDIAGNAFEDWSKQIRELARRQHVACKISGLPTYCAPGQATADAMRPWVESCIEAFGWDRVVWGSDWPVCEINSDLSKWSESLEFILAGASKDEQNALYSKNAKALYRL